MDSFEPRRVPVDTTEITYTGRGGRQVEIPIERKGKYAYATPANGADVAALNALGHTTVARKAVEDETPATGESKEG